MTASQHCPIASPREERRLVAIHRHGLLEAGPSPRLNAVVRLAANLLDFPLCRLAIVGSREVVCHAAAGRTPTDSRWPRALTFEDESWGDDKLFVALPRALRTQSVGGLSYEAQFYAAATVFDPHGLPVGVLQLVDDCPRTLTVLQRHALADFARLCESELFADAAPTGTLDAAWLRDPETGVVSRRHFRSELLKASYVTFPRVVCVRIENLHTLESRRGWDAVRRVQRKLTERLEEMVGSNTPIAMNDWASYVFVAPSSWDGRVILQELLMLSQRLACRITLGQQAFVPKIVMGASDAMSPDDDAGRVILEAYRAARFAHQNGHRAVVRSATHAENEQRRSVVLERLERALATRKLSLAVQPKFDRALRPMGGEVLARWIDDELGFVSPGEFIPVAEEHGLIRELGWCIVEGTCRLLSEAKARGSEVPPVAINVSTPQLESFSFAGDLLETLTVYGLTPQDVEIEITESVFSENVEQARRTLESLAEAGMSVYLDDYGTGYSSLSYLKSLPISYLKIDRAFVMELARESDDAAIVEATIAMAHALGISVVAEGVETEEQWRLLCEMGCDVVQGFWCGRPMPFDDFLQVTSREVAACAPKVEEP